MSQTKPTRYFNQYKLRLYNPKEMTYVITIPKSIGQQFQDVKFSVEVVGTQIILTSGLDLTQMRKDLKNCEIKDII